MMFDGEDFFLCVICGGEDFIVCDFAGEDFFYFGTSKICVKAKTLFNLCEYAIQSNFLSSLVSH